MSKDFLISRFEDRDWLLRRVSHLLRSTGVDDAEEIIRGIERMTLDISNGGIFITATLANNLNVALAPAQSTRLEECLPVGGPCHLLAGDRLFIRGVFRATLS